VPRVERLARELLLCLGAPIFFVPPGSVPGRYMGLGVLFAMLLERSMGESWARVPGVFGPDACRSAASVCGRSSIRCPSRHIPTRAGSTQPGGTLTDREMCGCIRAGHALVVLGQNMKSSAEELIEYARQLLAGFKVPKSVEFRDGPLPLSGAFEALKRELRRRYREGRDPR
jgi:hypothetical protein